MLILRTPAAWRTLIPDATADGQRRVTVREVFWRGLVVTKRQPKLVPKMVIAI